MKKTFFIFILLSVTLSLAQNSETKDFSDFEQSLLNKGSSSTPVADSTDTTNSTENFEKSLYTYHTDDEPFLLAREALLEAVNQKDINGIREKIATLDEMGTKSIIPLEDIEKEHIYIKFNMFNDYLKLLVTHYKAMYDTTKYDKEPRHISEKHDGLVIFTTKELEKIDTTRSFYFNIKDRIDSSTLSTREKDKIGIFILLRDAYRKNDVAEYLAKEVKQFIEKYPDDPEAKWMEKCIYGPLEKMNYYEYAMKMRKINKESVIKQKLYTGGLGFNIGLPIFGAPIGFDKFYRKDLYEVSDSEILNLELYLQISRLVFLGQMINSGIPGIWGYGFGLGFVVFDSRYLKIRPYFSVEMAGVDYSVKEDIPGKIYAGESEYSGFSKINVYTLDANIDYKFGTAYLFLSDRKFVSFAITSKIGMSYMDIDKACVKGSGVIPFAHLGLGIYFW